MSVRGWGSRCRVLLVYGASVVGIVGPSVSEKFFHEGFLMNLGIVSLTRITDPG